VNIIKTRGGPVVGRQAHNLKNAGANPAPATRIEFGGQMSL